MKVLSGTKLTKISRCQEGLAFGGYIPLKHSAPSQSVFRDSFSTQRGVRSRAEEEELIMGRHRISKGSAVHRKGLMGMGKWLAHVVASAVARELIRDLFSNFRS